MSSANTPVPTPQVILFNRSIQYLWSDGTPFNGYALIELIPPTDGSSPWTYLSYYNLSPSVRLPIFQKVPITWGYLDASSGLFPTNQLVPSYSRYRYYMYDNSDHLIAGPSSNFSVLSTDAAVSLPSLTLTAPALLSTPATPDAFVTNNVPASQSYTPSGINTVTWSATPTFDLYLGNPYIVLTGNVTSSTLTYLQAGQSVTFFIKQDAVGGWTFAWPSNVIGGMTIGTNASSYSVQTFMSPDGLFLVATDLGQINES